MTGMPALGARGGELATLREDGHSSRAGSVLSRTSSSDTQSQVRLKFDSKEAALDYARENGIEATVQEPHKRKTNVRPRGYAENFAVDRRGAWTH